MLENPLTKNSEKLYGIMSQDRNPFHYLMKMFYKLRKNQL